jgi:putative ABC transport system substrate-binding protein
MVNVAMVLWRGETTAEDGFKQAMFGQKEYRVSYTIFNANQSTQQLDAIVEQLQKSKFRLIYTFGTTVTQAVQKKIKNTPIVFNIVQRPIEAGIIKSWENSGNNLTGASNMVSAENAIRTLLLFMQVKKLGFLYFEKDPSSQLQKVDIKNQEKKFGFTTVDLPIKNKNSLSQTLNQVAEAKVDAILIPSDSFIKENADMVISALNRYKIPTIVIIPEMVKNNGALVGVGPDYLTLGKLAAENALEILRGKKPANLPTRTVPNLTASINLDTAERLGISIPLQLLKMSSIVHFELDSK